MGIPPSEHSINIILERTWGVGAPGGLGWPRLILGALAAFPLLEFYQLSLSLSRVSGFWSLVSGLWSRVCGLWSLVSGLWSLVSGLWPLVFGLGSLVSDLWSLVSGLWFLSLWSLVVGLSVYSTYLATLVHGAANAQRAQAASVFLRHSHGRSGFTAGAMAWRESRLLFRAGAAQSLGFARGLATE